MAGRYSVQGSVSISYFVMLLLFSGIVSRKFSAADAVKVLVHKHGITQGVAYGDLLQDS